MERKLATIRKISKVIKHPNADNLDICTVDGWKVITKLGEFREGDLAVYFEVDSFIPIKQEFEFLRKSSYKKLSDGSEGFRLRTVRLREELSQGLLIPTSTIPLINNDFILLPYLDEGGKKTGEFFIHHQVEKYCIDLKEGLDITEILGVTKYEPPIGAILSGDVKGDFPSFLRKSDEARIQNFPELLDEYKDDYIYASEKLDGTSGTYYYKDNEFGVCSRNLELKEDESNTYWKVARVLDLENKLRSLHSPFSIQGEIIGPGIQGNKYKLQKPEFFIFNVFDIEKQSFLNFSDFLYFIHLEKIYAKLKNENAKEYQSNADSYVGNSLTIIH